MDRAGVQAAFNAAGLSRCVKDIDYLARTSIRLQATPGDEASIPVGASKLGGVPDLPAGVNWPEWQGLPQSFIAQIRLTDVQPYDTDHQLPTQGMFWFFYDAQQQTYGAAPTDKGGWRVLFTNTDKPPLQRTPTPSSLPATSQFHACTLTFANEITLSQQPQMEIPHFDWTTDEQQKYENLLSTFPTPADHAAIHHRLLGNPDTLQDDMRIQCQLTSNGVTDINDPRASALAKGAKDWQLLLQVDSDEHASMNWENSGMLYYWIRTADLKAQQFDATWLVLQSE